MARRAKPSPERPAPAVIKTPRDEYENIPYLPSEA